MLAFIVHKLNKYEVSFSFFVSSESERNHLKNSMQLITNLFKDYYFTGVVMPMKKTINVIGGVSILALTSLSAPLHLKKNVI